MPGPKSDPKRADKMTGTVEYAGWPMSIREARAKAKPNSKAAARLADRVASTPTGLGGFHTPGSQNRKK